MSRGSTEKRPEEEYAMDLSALFNRIADGSLTSLHMKKTS